MLATVLQNFGQSIHEPAFWLVAVSVMLFAHNRFKIQSIPPDTLDPPVHARSLTTRFRYGIALFTYMSIYWAVFVVLVCFGSIPEFQNLLEKVAGSISGEGIPPIASPAWAALVATSVLPSVPGFNTIDQTIRTFLHDISSIPTKAHRLAGDILQAALAEDRTPGVAYQKLCTVIEQLALKERTATVRLFSAFRREHQEFLDDIQKKFATSDPGLSPQASEIYLHELLVKLSRFLSCALLSSQPDELTARRHLKKLDLDLPEAGWQFRIEQIGVSVVTVSILTIAGGYLANLLMYFAASFFGQLSPDQINWDITFLAALIKWVLYAVPMFTLPLIFSAGIKLYLVDRQRYGSELDDEDTPWEDLFLGVILAFIGSYFLACFPILLGIGAQIDPTAPEAISLLVKMSLAWGLPPALFAVIFIQRSSVQPDGFWHGRLSDFLIHGLPVGLVSTVLAVTFITQTRGAISALQMQFMIASVSVLVAGFLGALNCSISRRALNAEAPRALADPESPHEDELSATEANRKSGELRQFEVRK